MTRGPLGKLIVADDAIELSFHGPLFLFRIVGLKPTRITKSDGGRVLGDMDPRWKVPRYRLRPRIDSDAESAAFYPISEASFDAALTRFGWPVEAAAP